MKALATGEQDNRSLSPQLKEERVLVVNGLRGFAALSVAWHHFCLGNPTFPTSGWLRTTGEYGYLGVEIFFVISGFIIPFAMHKAAYRLRNVPIFVAKRLLRLEPPYLVSIVITLCLFWVSSFSPGFWDSHSLTTTQVLLHLGYLNAVFGYDWINTAYWTLAIEFQYYLLMSVCFPLVAHAGMRVRVFGVLILCALMIVVPFDRLVFHYLGLFALGIATFQLRCALLPRSGYFALVAIASAANLWSLGPLVAGTGLVTAFLIAFAGRLHWRPLAWVGMVSYSFYLIHAPLGGRVVNLGARFAQSTVAQVGVLIAAVGVSVFVAWLLYVLVERPSLKVSSALRYRAENN